MGNTVGNVSAAAPKIAGAIFRGDVGTKLPTDAVSELDSAMKCLGFISEDGVTNSNSPSSSDVKAWGNDTVLTTQTERPDTFKFKLIESKNTEVLKTVYGDSNVKGDLSTGIEVKVTTEDLEEKSYVIDMILRDKTAKRMVIPRGKIISVADITYKGSDVIGYEVTVKASRDAAGASHYEYLKATDNSEQAAVSNSAQQVEDNTEQQ